jgi:hypothetical protein
VLASEASDSESLTARRYEMALDSRQKLFVEELNKAASSADK